MRKCCLSRSGWCIPLYQQRLNWVQIQLDNQIVTSFAVNGNNIFAGTGNLGVYISSNNGLNWAQTSLNNQFINVMTSNEGIIYAGGMMDWGSVYFSTNNGQNWTQTSLTNQYIEEICVIGCDIFVATRNNGVYFSSDSGLNWVQKNEGLENLDVYSLVLTPDYIFAGTRGKSAWKRPLYELVGEKNISKSVPKTIICIKIIQTRSTR